MGQDNTNSYIKINIKKNININSKKIKNWNSFLLEEQNEYIFQTKKLFSSKFFLFLTRLGSGLQKKIY